MSRGGWQSLIIWCQRKMDVCKIKNLVYVYMPFLGLILRVFEIFLEPHTDTQSQTLFHIVIFSFDPLGQSKVVAGRDNCFCTLFKIQKNKTTRKTMFAIGETVGLAEWIIDDTCLVIFPFPHVFALKASRKSMSSKLFNLKMEARS